MYWVAELTLYHVPDILTIVVEEFPHILWLQCIIWPSFHTHALLSSSKHRPFPENTCLCQCSLIYSNVYSSRVSEIRYYKDSFRKANNETETG